MNWKPFILALLLTSLLTAQDLQSPSEYLGYELGTKFTRHHRVVDYCEYLAEKRPAQLKLQEYGRTYEDRKLLLLYLSSAENISRLEEIRQDHLASRNGGKGSGKAIVWMSYNVHGNESVSTEAAMQTLYELLTSRKDYLDDTVVIIDPCINPDGRDRYVNWYNQVKNTPLQADPNSREHNEGWHSGRSNHYMFDLNRDWAWLTQKESRQRLEVYNEWMPQIHVDFHEQGYNNPYYFAPAAEPFHEVITSFQREFQDEIGKNHARYFDEKGWLYFTKERFDLFYPSYGDTYPTYNGAIGMTYEQGGGGRAGLGVITRIGDTLSLKDRILHHLTTGLSTVEVATKNIERLNEEYSKFFKNNNFRYKSYVLKGNTDHLLALSDWLNKHNIKYGKGSGNTVKGYRYLTGRNETIKADKTSLVIRTDQPKGTLVKVLFEPDAKLSDSLTYDITAWSLPYAYGLDAIATESTVQYTEIQKEVSQSNAPITDPYAYIADWNSMKDARFLAKLLQKGIRVRTTKSPFTIDGIKHERGSLIITKLDNTNYPNFKKKLLGVAKEFDKKLITTATGFVDKGKDLGSGVVSMIPRRRVAVLSGKPTSSLRFGEIWHFFEQQLGYPMVALETDQLNHADLSGYDVLILPGGNGYERFLDDEKRMKLQNWTENGGNLIIMGAALKAVADKDGFSLKSREIKKDSIAKLNASYESSARERIKEDVKGAIFKTEVDTSHPLAFGYKDHYHTLKLRNGSYEMLETGNVAVIRTAVEPVAGFSGSETPARLKNSLVFGVQEKEEGRIIYLVDNPLFRGFWENGKLFFVNALFMVN